MFVSRSGIARVGSNDIARVGLTGRDDLRSPIRLRLPSTDGSDQQAKSQPDIRRCQTSTVVGEGSASALGVDRKEEEDS